jgi:hypothetical protein
MERRVYLMLVLFKPACWLQSVIAYVAPRSERANSAAPITDYYWRKSSVGGRQHGIGK